MKETKMNRREFLWTSTALASSSTWLLAGCGSDDNESPKNRYKQANLVANSAAYGAAFVFPGFVNAWGISTRPAGAGGHFWVMAGEKSWQFVGDVKASPDAKLRAFFQDDLREVTIPGADSDITDASIGKSTGTVFNGAPLDSNLFRVSGQTATVDDKAVEFDGSARFIFVTDSGKVTAWTDRAKDGNIVRRDGPTQEVFDGAAEGMALFGVAIDPRGWDTLWLADFGAAPQIRTLNANWQLVPTKGFVNPFATGASVDASTPSLGKRPKPGDPVPFNIQVIGQRAYVAYCISQADPADALAFYAAEEEALDATSEKAANFKPNKGKLVEFDLDGNFVRTFEDDARLNAPWGIAKAPENFGALSNTLLVGNFGGAGLISAFDAGSGKFVDHLRDEKGERVAIEGLWALAFGNGASLGDSNALYFAAGPKDETEGLFGSLRTIE
jgi:uncharacterized protein (TIGR03118 family)